MSKVVIPYRLGNNDKKKSVRVQCRCSHPRPSDLCLFESVNAEPTDMEARTVLTTSAHTTLKKVYSKIKI